MESVILGLIFLALWWVVVGLIYWFVIRPIMPSLESMTRAERAELLKTKRQRNLK